MANPIITELLDLFDRDPQTAEARAARDLVASLARARAAGPPREAWGGLAKRVAGVAGVACDAGVLRAKSEAEVLALVAHARDQKLRLRTVGAGHSIASAIGDTDAAVDDLVLVLDGAMRSITFLEETSDRARVRVGGGCNLGVNPSDPTSNEANSVCRVLDTHGYALPILGGISHQTVAGFLATGSSGGSLAHGMSDIVAEMEIVDGTGQKRVLRRGTDELHAAAVSMGLFGIVTSVTLDVPRAYHVEGTEVNVTFDESLLAKRPDGTRGLRDALGNIEYLHLNWFPQKHVQRVMQWVGKRVEPSVAIVAYENTLHSDFVATMAGAVLELESALVELDAESEVVQRLLGFLMRPFLPLHKVQPFRDVWHHALPTDDQVDVDDIIKTYFTEVWLPAESTDRVIDVLERLFRDHPAAAGNFATEIYGAKKSKFWLSAAYDRDVIRIDPYFWAHNYGTPEAYFTRFWDVLLDIPGARLHWGKYMPKPGQRCGNTTFDAAYLDRMYPKLAEWRALRRDFDPDGIFLTPYWKERLAIP